LLDPLYKYRSLTETATETMGKKKHRKKRKPRQKIDILNPPKPPLWYPVNKNVLQQHQKYDEAPWVNLDDYHIFDKLNVEGLLYFDARDL
jgi:hypothetical protein